MKGLLDSNNVWSVSYHRPKCRLHPIPLMGLLLLFASLVGVPLDTVAAPPKVVEAVPDNGDTDVDPALQQIIVKFDQDMNTRGYSWVQNPEKPYPGAPDKQPRWIDSQTCALPVALRPNTTYWVSVNHQRYNNFRSVNGEPAEPYPIEFTTGDWQSQPPKVVSASPDNGDTGVSPSVTEIRVEFDQDMTTGRQYSWVGGGETFPEVTGPPRWVNPRVCVLPVKLEPNHEYRLSINSESYKNFINKNGQPAEPYLIAFKTGSRESSQPEPPSAPTAAAPPPAQGFVKGWSEEKRLVTVKSIERFFPTMTVNGNTVFITYTEGPLKMLISRDAGKTWSNPVVLSGNLDINSSPAIATLNDEIVVVWPAVAKTEDVMCLQLHMVRSTDNGRTWSSPKRITRNVDDCVSPRLLSIGDALLLVWQQTPVEGTLGGVDLNKRADWTPDAITPGITKFETGSVSRGGLNVRVAISCCVYNQADASFTPPRRIQEIFAKQMPTLFQLYGPEENKVFLTFNVDTEIKTLGTTDRGQTWSPEYVEGDYFDTRTIMNVISTSEGRKAVWIRRNPYEALPINFRDSEDETTVSLTPPYFIRSLPALAVEEDVYHVAWSAGESDFSWIAYMRTDDIRPTTRLTAPKSPHISLPRIRFEWTGDDNVSDSARLTYQTTYGKNPWSSFDKPTFLEIATPPDGEYTFRLRAMDVAGNLQEPPTEFTFDTFNAAPETRIVDKPSATPKINRRSYIMKATGEDNTQKADELLYSYQMDNGDWTEFQKQREFEFTKLANGKHTFRVRTKDARGNVDETPDEMSVVVEIGLEVQFVTTPPKYTNSDRIEVSWKGIDNTGEGTTFTYFYRLNNEDPVEVGSQSTIQLEQLEEAEHTFTVWAVDPAGNRSAEESSSFVIDRTPPETFATFNHRWSPAGSFPIVYLEGTDPPIGDAQTSRSVKEFQFHFGEGQWQDFSLPGGKDWVVTKSIPFYGWGYKVTVRAVDPAGNVDPTPSTVDLTMLGRFTDMTCYIAGGVGGVIVLIILYLLLKKLRRRKPVVPSSSLADPYAGLTGQTTETSSEETSTDSSDTENKDNPFYS